jgi:uncharacterized protein
VSGLAFTWDPRKAATNWRKHHVSFEQAATVFDDPLVLLLADWEHGEPRIVAIGAARTRRVLFVVATDLETDVVRIISARTASKQERRRYEEGD